MAERAWSQQVTQKVDFVRQLPATNVQEKQHKKEQAGRLRLETQLMTGRMMMETNNILSASPSLTRDELEEAIIDTGFVTHPEGLQHYIHHLVDQKARVDRGLEHVLQHQTEQELTQELFTRLQHNFNPDKEPQAAQYDIKIDTNNPIALVLIMNEKDFEVIDPRVNSGGYYSKFEPINLPGEEPATVPIIVVTSEDFVGHEVTHGTNKVTQDALATLDTADLMYMSVWGNVSLSFQERKLMFQFLNRSDSLEKIQDSGTDILDVAISYALGRAKDELLADWQRSLRDQTIRMTTHDSLYDYFTLELGVKPVTDVHEYLWDTYKTRFRESTETLVELHQYYTSAGLTGRLEMFPHVFSQIPIESMQAQLGIYMSEYREFESFCTHCDSIARMLPNYFQIELTSDEEDLLDEADEIRNRVKDESNDNPEKSFYELLETYRPQLDQLESKIKESSVYELFKEIEDFKQTQDLMDDNDWEYKQILAEYNQRLTVSEPRISVEEVTAYHDRLKDLLHT